MCHQGEGIVLGNKVTDATVTDSISCNQTLPDALIQWPQRPRALGLQEKPIPASWRSSGDSWFSWEREDQYTPADQMLERCHQKGPKAGLENLLVSALEAGKDSFSLTRPPSHMWLSFTLQKSKMNEWMSEEINKQLEHETRTVNWDRPRSKSWSLQLLSYTILDMILRTS